jgi:hypothetical protein
MFRWLTYRCLGVACWVYLLGLVLAGLMYWAMPPSNVVLSWKFNNSVTFQGFTRDHRELVITEDQSGPAMFRHLNLETGEVTSYSAKDHPAIAPLPSGPGSAGFSSCPWSPVGL